MGSIPAILFTFPNSDKMVAAAVAIVPIFMQDIEEAEMYDFFKSLSKVFQIRQQTSIYKPLDRTQVSEHCRLQGLWDSAYLGVWE